MTKPTLTTQDLRNIQAALATARVDGISAAAALLVLHNKVVTIIKAEEAELNGNGNSTESPQQGADQPPADGQPDLQSTDH